MERTKPKEGSQPIWILLDAIQLHYSYADMAGARMLLRNAMKDGSGSVRSRDLVKKLIELLDTLEREKE